MKHWWKSVCALLLSASLGAAAAESPSYAGFKRANEKLVAAMDSAARRDRPPPMLADPASAQLVRSAFDERVLLLPGLDNLLLASQTLQLVAQSYKGYMFFKIANRDMAALSEADTERIRKNEVRFQDEIALAGTFMIDAGARQLGSMARFWRGLPADQRTDIRKHGIRTTRMGLAQMVAGAVIMQTELSKPSSRRLMLDAVVRHLEPYSASLSPTDRKTVIDAIDMVLAGNSIDSGTAGKFKRIRNAMSRKDCTGFCAI